MKWISVNDRLPDKAGDYLVAIADRWRGKTNWIIDRVFFRGKTTWATGNQEIEYWMPLPAPPEE